MCFTPPLSTILHFQFKIKARSFCLKVCFIGKRNWMWSWIEKIWMVRGRQSGLLFSNSKRFLQLLIIQYSNKKPFQPFLYYSSQTSQNHPALSSSIFWLRRNVTNPCVYNFNNKIKWIKWDSAPLRKHTKDLKILESYTKIEIITKSNIQQSHLWSKSHLFQ